jgi:predicted transcriptional regulator
MTNGGKRLRELLKEHGFIFSAVADAIGVPRATMYRWTNTAPIDKLIKLSEFTHIPMMEIIDCFRPDPSQATQDDRTGGEENN